MKTEKKRHPGYIKFVLLTAVMLVIGGKWYTYVTLADTPFDDFGSSINAMMPAPINKVGCDLLKQRFGNIPIPPRGCESEGRWI